MGGGRPTQISAPSTVVIRCPCSSALIEDRRQTNHVTIFGDRDPQPWPMTLIFNPQQAVVMTHIPARKQGHSKDRGSVIIPPRYHPCWPWPSTSTYDLDFQSPASYGHDPRNQDHSKVRGSVVIRRPCPPWLDWLRFLSSSLCGRSWPRLQRIGAEPI